jgi:predicted HicB family RNase H-like nuclease
MVERDAERKLHIRLTQDMHRRLRIRCAELDVTIQDYVVRMLDQALAGASGHEDKPRARRKERSR